MFPFVDLHTHRLPPEEAVISVSNLLLHQTTDPPGLPFSAGLHPWYADQLSADMLSEALELCALSENFVAFGETGLDKVCRTPLKLQQDIFEIHLKKAAKFRKPLILHCVKAWDELIEIAAGYPLIKILHGYNGSARLSERLLKNGFQFSIGEGILNNKSKIHSSVDLIPLTSLFCETDTSDLSIRDIYARVSAAFQIEEEEFRAALYANFVRIRGELK